MSSILRSYANVNVYVPAHAQGNSMAKLVRGFVAAWNRAMNVDRFDIVAS